MVKRLIQGILGKKGEEVKAVQGEAEIPDELPPLAEDVLEKSPAAISEPKTEPMNTNAINEVPQELPALEEQMPQKPNESQMNPPLDTVGTLNDLESHSEGIPDAIKMAKLAKMKFADNKPPDKPTSDLSLDLNIQKQHSDYTVTERINASEQPGFFSSVLEHLKKHGGAKESLLAGNLFSRMGNYWEIRKHEIKSGTPLPLEKKIENDLMKKLEELRYLEQKWQIQKLALEEDLKFIHEREREIQSKIKELEFTSNELRLFREVKPEEYFYLHNGVLIKSLHDLIDILEIIDEDTFAFHVTSHKNDFAEWIRHVFKDNRLADSLKSVKSKLDMVEILETIPLMNDEMDQKNRHTITNPKKYFWLSNGAVIRSLYELSDSLKVMDEQTFKLHVTADKNDFSKWVKDVLKNEHLADKLGMAKTRKEMIEILEAFI